VETVGTVSVVHRDDSSGATTRDGGNRDRQNRGHRHHAQSHGSRGRSHDRGHSHGRGRGHHHRRHSRIQCCHRHLCRRSQEHRHH